MRLQNLFWMIEKTPDGQHQGVIVTRRGDRVWAGQAWPSDGEAYNETARELRRRIGLKQDGH